VVLGENTAARSACLTSREISAARVIKENHKDLGIQRWHATIELRKSTLPPTNARKAEESGMQKAWKNIGAALRRKSAGACGEIDIIVASGLIR